ncbi:hypothetical protein [Staphylococcus ratti]|uniref:C2H2-type domain-containing protein n=1 Tax=Staphylococcus ratti TaxID=2892440 RepID=A0ABY3PB62_9STAP|nr:hypothetical protein [Staphylococcus ratti]UEX89547.1 hypothetical protein LN051_08205 [Staphylococcus ratti]
MICPKCQSQRVGETRSGCLLLLVIFGTIFFGIQFIVYASSGALRENTLGSSVVLLFYLIVVAMIWIIYKKKGQRYYCIACQSEFKPHQLKHLKNERHNDSKRG